MTCNHRKYKRILTHGKKSRGYYVCSHCKEVIKKPERKKNESFKRKISKR